MPSESDVTVRTFDGYCLMVGLPQLPRSMASTSQAEDCACGFHTCRSPKILFILIVRRLNVDGPKGGNPATLK